MIVKKLHVKNFRNHADTEIEFGSGVNVLLGENAQGKTNLLEAIFLTCVGRGWRTKKDADMIKFGEGRAQVRAVVNKKYGEVSVNVLLQDSVKVKSAGQGGAKKEIKVNDIPIGKMGELMGQVTSVFFSPDELRLVKEAPADRRRFMDIDISQINKQYFYDLLRYNKILAQRNALLKSVTEDIRTGLDIWDDQIAEYGARIIQGRISFLGELVSGACDVHRGLSGGREILKLEYESFCPEVACDLGIAGMGRDVEEIKTRLLAEYKKNRDRDMRLRTTTVGPHRDDIAIYLSDASCDVRRDARSFASQGQQRTIALSIKLAELQLFKKKTGEMPILLLDDVFSELDSGRQARLLEFSAGCQTIITTNQFDMLKTLNVKVFTVSGGEVV